MSGRWFRPNFLVESFSRSLRQESHIIHRSELSEDHFHEWAMIPSKFSCRYFLRSLIQESHNNYRIELSGDHFLELALISSKYSTREFLVIYNTREPHQTQKWAIWRQFSWVGDDFVEIFMSRVSRDLWYKRTTSFTEVSYMETIFMSGRWFRPNFLVESFARSLIQESHIIHRSELSEDHFLEWAMISSKLSSREILEIFKPRKPHLSQKWAIWRPFSWVGDDFVQIFMSRFLEIFNTREPQQLQNWAIWRPFSWVGVDFVQIFISRVSCDL